MLLSLCLHLLSALCCQLLNKSMEFPQYNKTITFMSLRFLRVCRSVGNVILTQKKHLMTELHSVMQSSNQLPSHTAILHLTVIHSNVFVRCILLCNMQYT